MPKVDISARSKNFMSRTPGVIGPIATTVACLMLFYCTAASPQEYKIVMEPSPPLQYLSDNGVTGSVAKKVTDLFHNAGIEAELEIFPWTRALSKAESQNNVFISNIARTPERENLFKWIGVVYSYNFALVSPGKTETAVDLESAKNYTIAVQRNDIAQQYLQEKGFSEDKNLFITTDISESWRLLDMGNVDFVVEDIKIIEYMAGKHLDKSKRIEKIIPLPDLAFDAWIAANPDIDDEIIEKLASGFPQ